MLNKLLNSLLARKLLFSNLRSYSVKVKFLKKPIDPDVASIFQKHEQSILYSSYREDHFLKLGYKKSRALQEMIKVKEKEMKIASGKVKEFPLALKYIASPEDSVKYEEVTNSQCDRIVFSKEEEEFLDSIREKEMKRIKAKVSPEEEQPDWLHDYEYFDENEDANVKYGTPDPTIPISKVPCNGCGAALHCAEPSLPGYLPSEIFKGRSSTELKTIICQRCHFLKNYNTALNVSVHPDEYLQMISSISHKHGLGMLIVDLLDFPSSIWSDVSKVIGERRPLFIVGNKVDLIPKDSRNYLNNIKVRLMEEVTKKGLLEKNIKHIALVSATTGYGIEELITNLHHKWGTRGDVYLIGATNVGKSSLFNALLRSDYCKIQAQDLVSRATASPWPGTTLRLLKFPILRPSDYRIYLRTQRLITEQYAKGQEAKLRQIEANKTGKLQYATLMGHIGQTFRPEPEETADSFAMGGANIQPQALNEDNKDYRDSKWCYDTPGIILPDQIHHRLNIEEILRVIPKEMLRPRVFFIKSGLSLFLAGIGRIDYVSGMQPIRLFVYASLKLPMLVCETEKAEEIYTDLLPTDALQVPQNTIERSSPWTGLKCAKELSLMGNYSSLTVADIVFGSIGWIGVNGNKDQEISLRVWSPDGQGVSLRQPALLEEGFRLRGKRIRDSVAHKIGKAFIKQ